MMSASRRVFVRCLENNRHPDLPLAEGKPLILGRSHTTRIKDSRLSRQQLKLELISNDELVVNFENVGGGNSSSVGGKELKKNQGVTVSQDTTFHLLNEKYPYKVIFPVMKEKSPNTSPTVAKKSKMSNTHWSAALLASMNDPELKVRENEKIVVIKDKYPKARYHFLVMPKKKVNSLKDLTKDDVPLLEAMQDEGLQLSRDHNGHRFRLGYHAVPSMAQVHLHVISQDFVSPCLKTKKHWNSFNTEYFIESEEVIDQLRREGVFRPVSSEAGKQMLAKDLKCHRCSFRPKNMTDLKTHLESH